MDTSTWPLTGASSGLGYALSAADDRVDAAKSVDTLTVNTVNGEAIYTGTYRST